MPELVYEHFTRSDVLVPESFHSVGDLFHCYNQPGNVLDHFAELRAAQSWLIRLEGLYGVRHMELAER